MLSLMFVLLCLTPAMAYGQDEPEPDDHGKADTPQHKPSLLIINGSDSTKVNFALKNGDSNWVDFSLNPRQDTILHNTTSIRIASENGKTVEYRLQYANRYRIYWNRTERCWDVTKLVTR